ncbi:hypothetical protein ACFYZJ_37510 [Streptomyces sp. NPDC001848]|uniref:hypothetical protein n=1 Tax=Streptomyces sp. NPDC001848 TaxID=3364618 RepID=UPI00368958D3
MYGRGTMAATGTGLIVFGQSLSFSTVLAISVALTLTGALIYRFATRNKKYDGA